MSIIFLKEGQARGNDVSPELETPFFSPQCLKNQTSKNCSIIDDLDRGLTRKNSENPLKQLSFFSLSAPRFLLVLSIQGIVRID